MTPPSLSRRTFINRASLAAAGAAFTSPSRTRAQTHSAFQLGILTDEISHDFDHACAVASKQFGLQWVSLRTLWHWSVVDLDPSVISRAQSILKKYDLRVSDIASPLFKVDWPGAPRSKFSTRQNFSTDNFAHQHHVLSRCLALGEQFKVDKIRCFDFWRLDDVAPYRDAIDNMIGVAAEAVARQGMQLVVENDFECNTATSTEVARLLGAVPLLWLAWDPANAVMAGELDAFPRGWSLIPKDRIRLCRCKNVDHNADGALEWSQVDVGFIDWTKQFRALKDAGYTGGIQLETHWSGGGTPEECSRISLAAMKRALQAAGAL